MRRASMRILGSAFAICLVLSLAGCGGKSNADKIVGTWEITKSESDAPKGATVEFTKDGKIKMTAKVEGHEISMEGTYKVDGDKLTTTMKMGNKEKTETAKIKSLDDSTLKIEDEKGKVDEFMKK